MALYTCPDCGCEEVIIKQVNKRTGVYCKDCYKRCFGEDEDEED